MKQQTLFFWFFISVVLLPYLAWGADGVIPVSENSAAEPSAASTAVPPLSKPASSARHLTIEESVSIGLKGATDVLKAQNAFDATGTALLQAYGQFLPNLIATGNANYASGKTFFTSATPTVVNTNSYGGTLQLSATMNLFNGLSDFAGLRSSLEKEDSAQLTLQRAKQQIVIDVTQAFLQVVLDRHIVQIADKNLASSSERQRLLRAQTKVGVRALADLFRQEAQTKTDESFLITSQNKLRNDQILLLRRLRLEIQSDYDFAEPSLNVSIEVLPDEKHMIRAALEKRSDLKASTANVESTEWLVRSAKGGYLPKLDLGLAVVANDRYFNSQYVNGINVTPASQEPLLAQLGDHTNYVVGLTLTWNLFDRFVTALNVERAHVDADNARIDLEDRRLQVEGEIRQVYGDFRAAVQQVDTSNKGMEAAQKAYDTVQGRYQVGAASFVDVLTVQSALIAAETAQIQAKIGLALQEKLITFYLGETAT